MLAIKKIFYQVWGPSHGEGAGKANPREHPEWFSDESVSKPRSKAVAHSVVRLNQTRLN